MRQEYSPTVRRVVGPTILLHSGSYFDFLAPDACDFTIGDVANGLSMTCRFAGQCDRFYSVAEHSVIASWHVPERHAYDALMHDAAEAFVGDVAKPLKDLLGDFRDVEGRVETVVFKRFGVSNPLPAEVKEIDTVLLATEQRLLMRNRDDWNYTLGREPLSIEQLPCWSPERAKAMFLQRFDELTAK